MVRIGLKQLESLCVLSDRVGVALEKARGSTVVLLGKYELPRHSNRQFGQALDVLFDGFLDETARIQVGFRFGQRRFQLAFPQVGVLLVAHDDIFRLAAHCYRGFLPTRERLFDGADALGLQVVRRD